MKHVNFAPQGIATRDYASQATHAARKPYNTLTRERGAVYLRDCIRAGRDPKPSEMVRKGIGANWKSAQRILVWLIEANLTYRESA